MNQGPQPTLTGRVRQARRARLHARWGESLILGVAAALFLLCLALLSGSQGLEKDAWFVAGICSALVGALWMFETRQPEHEWACRVDRSLGLNGRLLAAMNVERMGDGAPMGQLLIEGLRSRVTRKTLLQRAVPVSLWLLVLPFVGGSLLMQGLHSQRNQVIRWDRSAPQFRALQDRLGEAHQRALAVADDPGLQAQVQAMREVARRGGIEMELGQGDPEAWNSELNQLAKDLAGASGELRGDGEWDRAMDQAQALVASLQDRAGERSEPAPEMPGGEAAGSDAPGAGPAQGGGDSAGGVAAPGAESMGSRNAGGSSGGPQGGSGGDKITAGPASSGSQIEPNWGSHERGTGPIPRVPRPYRSLVRSFLASQQ